MRKITRRRVKEMDTVVLKKYNNAAALHFFVPMPHFRRKFR